MAIMGIGMLGVFLCGSAPVTKIPEVGGVGSRPGRSVGKLNSKAAGIRFECESGLAITGRWMIHLDMVAHMAGAAPIIIIDR